MNGYLRMSKCALITGSSRGLGAHLARRLWDEGWSIGLSASKVNTLEGLASSLQNRHGQIVRILPCDLAIPEEVASLGERVKGSFPKLDLLVNNAAIQGPIGPFTENNLNAWNSTIQVNLLSPIQLCHSLSGYMVDGGGGTIINLSGGGAAGPRANFSAYATSKTGLVRFSEILAREMAGKNLNINSIAPGAMKTFMTEEVLKAGVNLSGNEEAKMAEKTRIEGGASMDIVADLVIFLASNSGKKITGKLISAIWDNWSDWQNHIKEISGSDVYTLRRIVGSDRGFNFGDIK